MNPTVRVSTLDAAQQALLERALGSHIGPLAKTLVRKESARAADYEALVQALARHIDEPQDRIKFLAVVRKPAA
jgi:serine/threonine-protein kinase